MTNEGTPCNLDKTLLTNFKQSELEIYQQAIKESGWGDRLYILNEAFDVNGRRTGALSLHTKSNEDHGAFWEVFDRIKYQR